MNSDKDSCISPKWEEISSGLPIEHFHKLIIDEYGSLLNFRLAFIKKCREKERKTKATKFKQNKTQKSIVDVATEFGLKLKKRGKAYFTLCIFHDERTPSLALYPTSNRYYCYGCGAKGNVQDFEAYLTGK